MSWVSSPVVSVEKFTPSNFVNDETATARAGMLMPSDSVSVAKTTLIRPRWKSSSTISLWYGSRPAWCSARPRRSKRASTMRRNSDSSSASFKLCSRSAATRSISSFSAVVVRSSSRYAVR